MRIRLAANYSQNTNFKNSYALKLGKKSFFYRFLLILCFFENP